LSITAADQLRMVDPPRDAAMVGAGARCVLRVAVRAVDAEGSRPDRVVRGPVDAVARRVPVVAARARPRGAAAGALGWAASEMNCGSAGEVGDRPALGAASGRLVAEPEGDPVVRAAAAPEPLPVPIRADHLRGAVPIRSTGDAGDVVEPASEILLRPPAGREPRVARSCHGRSRPDAGAEEDGQNGHDGSAHGHSSHSAAPDVFQLGRRTRSSHAAGRECVIETT